jgi:PadR family transcriptional regulator, regulatory protein PadR
MANERPPQMTRQTMVTLSILMKSTAPIAGSEIGKQSRLASGTLYPILIRLEQAGWIRSEWEEKEGAGTRPRSRLYRVTGLGVHGARKEAKAWKPLVERFV